MLSPHGRKMDNSLEEGISVIPCSQRIKELCEKRPQRKYLRTRGVLRGYEASGNDREILSLFKVELGRGIIRQYRSRGITRVREFHPHELDAGCIVSLQHAVTVYIPLSSERTMQPARIQYQKHASDPKIELTSWNLGDCIRVVGGYQLHVDNGPLCFGMVQFPWSPPAIGEHNGNGKGRTTVQLV